MMGHMNLTGPLFKSRTRGVGGVGEWKQDSGIPSWYISCVHSMCVCVWGGLFFYSVNPQERKAFLM